MCGIAGVATLAGRAPIDLGRLRAMTDSLLHRGPDETGSEICDGVALGMRRLSIIDLEGGSQPLYNEDRTVRVVFNGEIYNYRELRRGLEARGHQLMTHTDGEVIPTSGKSSARGSRRCSTGCSRSRYTTCGPSGWP